MGPPAGAPATDATTLSIQGPPETLVPGSALLPYYAGLAMAVAGSAGIAAAVWWRWRRRRRAAPPTRPVGLVIAGALTVIGVVTAVAYRPPAFWVPEFPALPRLLPDDAFFYQPVDSLPPAADSDRQVAALREREIVVGVSSEVIDGSVRGKPFNLVDADTPRQRFTFGRPGRSDEGEYPVTEPAYIQGMPWFHTDDHYIAVDLEERTMWEVISIRNWFGHWWGSAGARWDLDELRYPDGTTTASGLPMLPGLVTYAEVAAGEVDHAMAASSPVSARGRFVWPARGSDGVSDDPEAPPMGTWLRLRADTDLSGLGPQALTIALGLRTHGVVISDTAPAFAVHGTPDARWDDDDLRTLRRLTTSDFEVVDTGTMMVSPDSMQANPLPSGATG